MQRRIGVRSRGSNNGNNVKEDAAGVARRSPKKGRNSLFASVIAIMSGILLVVLFYNVFILTTSGKFDNLKTDSTHITADNLEDTNLKPNEVSHNEATRLMMLQSSTFVDGEKKLKAELKKVMERQAQGKDLGIKVASRWEDGVPVVYPGEKHVN